VVLLSAVDGDISPNSTWLVTSRVDALDTSNVSCRAETWRHEQSGIWAVGVPRILQ